MPLKDFTLFIHILIKLDTLPDSDKNSLVDVLFDSISDLLFVLLSDVIELDSDRDELIESFADSDWLKLAVVL